MTLSRKQNCKEDSVGLDGWKMLLVVSAMLVLSLSSQSSLANQNVGQRHDKPDASVIVSYHDGGKRDHGRYVGYWIHPRLYPAHPPVYRWQPEREHRGSHGHKQHGNKHHRRNEHENWAHGNDNHGHHNNHGHNRGGRH